MDRAIERADDPGLTALWCRSLEDRLFHETGVVHAALCDPASGVSCARDCGISAASFVAGYDLRLIYLACELAAPHGLGAVLSLAKRALRADHLWDDDAPAWQRGPHWSDASFDAFAVDFCSFPAPALQRLAIREHAEALRYIVARQRDAEAHYGEACRLLTGDPLRFLDFARKVVAA